MKESLASFIHAVVSNTSSDMFGFSASELKQIRTLVKLYHVYPNLSEDDKVELKAFIEALHYGYEIDEPLENFYRDSSSNLKR